MRRILLAPLLMALCLLLVPDRAPVALSQPSAPSSTPVAPEYVDDGVNLPTEATFARLAGTDPVACLQACMRRYKREIHALSGEMHKQETIDGKLQPPEVMDFSFREEPYSVLV